MVIIFQNMPTFFSLLGFYKHQLHKHCYYNLIENNIHRCPSCRADFNERINHTCQFCNKSIEIHDSDSEILKSGDCSNCYFHYDCFKRRNHTHCGKCSHPINPENVSALSYLYFQNGFDAWVGPLQKCRNENCHYLGSPKRFGYCSHHRFEETMNKSVAKTFEYMVKYTNIQDQQERYDTFYKVVKYLDKKYNNQVIIKNDIFGLIYLDIITIDKITKE